MPGKTLPVMAMWPLVHYLVFLSLIFLFCSAGIIGPTYHAGLLYIHSPLFLNAEGSFASHRIHHLTILSRAAWCIFKGITERLLAKKIFLFIYLVEIKRYLKAEGALGRETWKFKQGILNQRSHPHAEKLLSVECWECCYDVAKSLCAYFQGSYAVSVLLSSTKMSSICLKSKHRL